MVVSYFDFEDESSQRRGLHLRRLAPLMVGYIGNCVCLGNEAACQFLFHLGVHPRKQRNQTTQGEIYVARDPQRVRHDRPEKLSLV